MDDSTIALITNSLAFIWLIAFVAILVPEKENKDV
jgi:hypothetical protein